MGEQSDLDKRMHMVGIGVRPQPIPAMSRERNWIGKT